MSFSSSQYLQPPPKPIKKQRPGSSSGGALKKGAHISQISSAGGEESDGTRQLSPLRQPVIKMSMMRQNGETRNNYMKTTSMGTDATQVNRTKLGQKKLTMLQTSEEVSGSRAGRVIPLSSKINSFVSKTGGSFFKDEAFASNHASNPKQDKSANKVGGVNALLRVKSSAHSLAD